MRREIRQTVLRDGGVAHDHLLDDHQRVGAVVDVRRWRDVGKLKKESVIRLALKAAAKLAKEALENKRIQGRY